MQRTPLRRFWPSIAMLLFAGAVLGGCAPEQDRTSTGTALAIGWDQLIPEDYVPDDTLSGLDLSGYADNDPRAIALLEQLRASWHDTPVVTALDGERIRLGGFVVPLESDGTFVTEFLLVPYYGACIHVPPPPPNQVVHVQMDRPGLRARLFDAVWLTGTLRAQRHTGEIADAGYTMRPDRAESF